ncbi:MAG: HAMP domain-containing sensor histidine kinase [Merismopediaceae bacterium]|nr:HAMP domain-containing sensor histidine kinase [Merismopediaceae bacterium]
MFALSPPPWVSSSMVFTANLLHLIRTTPELEQLPQRLVDLMGQEWTVEIGCLVMGYPGEHPHQALAWTPAEVVPLNLSSRFWRQGWVKRLQQEPYPLVLPPGVSATDSQGATGGKRWKLSHHLAIASGIGMCTVFQGRVNGALILGSAEMRSWSASQIEALAQCQEALAIAHHFYLTRPQSPPHLIPPAPHLPISPSSNPPSRPLSKEDNPIFKLWYDATHQQLEQQRQSQDQLIHNIVTIMSDQTRNPLAIIRMGIEMLRKRPPSPEDLQNRLAVIEREWHKLNEINEKILKLRTVKFDHTSLFFQSIDPIQFCQSFFQDYQAQGLVLSSHPSLPVELQIPDALPPWKIDVQYFTQILQELVINAEKFSVPSHPLKILLREKTVLGVPSLEISCQNETVSVDSKNLKYWFDPFYREQRVIDTAIPGIGLGLSIAKSLVEQLNGTIEVTCEPTTDEEQSLICFSLTFPLENGVRLPV